MKTIRLFAAVFLFGPMISFAQVSPQAAGFAGQAQGLSGTPALPAGVTPDMAREFLERNPGLKQSIAPGVPGGNTGDQQSKPAQAEPTPQDQTPKPDPLKSTDITPRPGTFQFFLAQATGRTIPLYGQALFSRSNTFSDLQSQPVPANYVVGPGDEILLKVYGGAVEFDQRLVVDRSGMVTLPKVGPVSVAGLAVADLDSALRKHIGRVLTDFNLFVSMGALRGIEIYVVGQARAPGKYVVSSVSTLINALFATGGPSDRGTMRSIELVRDSKIVTRFDLYDFISRGDKSKDVRLLPGDVINIPAAGPKVALVGSVANEAIFEIPPSPHVTAVKDLISLAGGLPVVTSPLQASLERVEPGRARPLLATTISLDDTGLNTPVKDGDILTLFPIKPAFENAVSLRLLGSPAARFPMPPGARVSDLIPTRETLLTSDFWLRRFQPGQADDNAANRMSAIRNISRIDQINWDQATIERIRKDDLTTQVISFNLGQAILKKDPAHDHVLEPGDVITVYSQRSVSVPEAKQTRVVQIDGEVNAPGIYQLRPGETLPELLARAGGLTPNAYVYGTALSRVSVREEQRRNLNLIIRELESQLASASANTLSFSGGASDAQVVGLLSEQNRQRVQGQVSRLRAMTPNGRVTLEMDPVRQRLPDIALEDGDTIQIPKAPGHVSAVGAVYNDSVLIYRSGRKVVDYLNLAGVTNQAERFNTFVVRADGTIVAPPRESVFSFNSDVSSKIASIELMPGDTIVVPEKFTRESGYSVFMRGLKDWTQVLYQLGLGAAAIKVLN